MLHVIGVDPGKVTGLAFWTRVYEDNGFELGPHSWSTYETYKPITYIQRFIDDYVNASDFPHHVIIACERYTITQRTVKATRQSAALEVIGQVKELASKYSQTVRLNMQQPSIAKRIADNETLRKLGMYTQTKDNHANDAARHVLVALLTFQAEVFYEMMRPGKIDPSNE